MANYKKIREEAFSRMCVGKGEYDYNNWLWDTLLQHIGHNVRISVYGTWDDIVDVCLEDCTTNEIILDAELYTICAREDV